MKRDDLSGIRVVLLSGEDFQRSERLKEILDAVIEPATRDFNCDIFTKESFTLEALSDVIVTFPMMADRRVVVVRDFDSIHQETRKKAAAVIAETPETTLVVVEGEKAKLTPKPPAEHLLSESFKVIYENRLPAWIQKRFEKRGKSVRPAAVALLINNVGTILRELDSEIEKVSAATAEKDQVTEQDVSRFVGEFRHDSIWNLQNAVGRGDFDEALTVLTRLSDAEKNKESYYLSSLAGHIMKIAEYNNQRRAGLSHNEAMKVVTTSPFLWNLNRYGDQAKRYGTAKCGARSPC